MCPQQTQLDQELLDYGHILGSLNKDNEVRSQVVRYIISNIADAEDEAGPDDLEMDEKYDEAVEVVLKTGQASISMLQRKLRVGYNRAARMIEIMETQGIVGPSDGVRPRDVYGRRGD